MGSTRVRISSRIRSHKDRIHTTCTSSSPWHHKTTSWAVMAATKPHHKAQTPMTCTSHQQCLIISHRAHTTYTNNPPRQSRRIIWTSRSLSHFPVAMMKKNWKVKANFNNRRAVILWQTIDLQALTLSRLVVLEQERAANLWWMIVRVALMLTRWTQTKDQSEVPT